MPEPQKPTTTKRPPPFVLRDRFPERSRLQLFVYDRQARQYRSAGGRHCVFILRSEAEAERFWLKVQELVEHPERWQE